MIKERPMYRFKAGDSVPECILSPDNGSDEIERMTFCVDVEVFYKDFEYQVYPKNILEPCESMVFIEPVKKDGANITLNGGPTCWNTTPLIKEPIPEFKAMSASYLYY